MFVVYSTYLPWTMEHSWWCIYPRQIWKCYGKVKWFADKGKRGGNDKKRNAGVEASKRRKSRIRKKKYMKNGGSIPSLEESLWLSFLFCLKLIPCLGMQVNRCLLDYFSLLSYILLPMNFILIHRKHNQCGRPNRCIPQQVILKAFWGASKYSQYCYVMILSYPNALHGCLLL